MSVCGWMVEWLKKKVSPSEAVAEPGKIVSRLVTSVTVVERVPSVACGGHYVVGRSM
jgi:hypothetical protein